MLSFFRNLWARIRGFFHRGYDDDGHGGDIVCYYGCPNSIRTAKLQLNRKTVR